MILFTIGSQGKDAKTFFEALLSNGVQKIVDIRLRNNSQLLGFTKGKDLSYIASTGFGIRYEHVPEFAPTAQILETNIEWMLKVGDL